MVGEEIYKLIPYSLFDIQYSLATNASPQLKRQIHLALLAYKKNDYNYENVTDYLDEILDIDFSNDEHTRRDYCIDGVVGLIIQVINTLKEKIEKQNEPYILVYFNSMGRLRASFESSVVLLRYGYYIESSPVFRLIYEQIAWSHSIIGKDIDEINKTKVTGQIKILNELIPNSKKLYGKYSAEAHLDPSEISSYFIENSENNGVGHRYRSGERSKIKYYDIFFLSTLYCKSIYKFFEHIGVLNDSTIINTPTGQISMTVKEQLDITMKSIQIFENTFSETIGEEYDEELPEIKILEDMMV
ncbi:hypothetical protein [Paenibacillus endoradicis]|uniref:hypothetical protein n=1 Tax=Paenibacillus endoradicis TaxID=2972487 RepID=UPI0021592A81|nr:hypothetical protein [Paenibacillus endoradicis]MCR8660176.1 hypothetical protein [Paenibacillus endoradicis]